MSAANDFNTLGKLKDRSFGNFQRTRPLPLHGTRESVNATFANNPNTKGEAFWITKGLPHIQAHLNLALTAI